MWPPSDDRPVTPAPLPDNPTTAITAVFVADGRRVVGVAVRDPVGLPAQVSVRVAQRTADAV
ncbi:hypothetical protein R6V09_37250 [Streptomyces sp. W16]|uniref:hypothetical protein n=1 Tax=Streptomyces sp. W16 TaxID=3076631 RepID=UPI00295A6179|nr:hypothetical protein [Streptomyces sp. W16]MDV9175750.1 hypothetical protein [Streptomyces sp. W16]